MVFFRPVLNVVSVMTFDDVDDATATSLAGTATVDDNNDDEEDDDNEEEEEEDVDEESSRTSPVALNLSKMKPFG